jgi:uncharacterized protein (DUF2132 family)
VPSIATVLPPRSSEQPKNPLHGVTLEAIVRTLVAERGFAELAKELPIPPFVRAPTIESTLKFLRRHPDERAAVEAFYLRTRT